MKRMLIKIYNAFENKKARYAFYFMIALFAGIFHNLDNPDELWNYNFAACVAKGLLPYRDFNMLQTPFSAFVNGVALAVFGQHLVVIRITGTVLFLFIAVESDKISRLLKMHGVGIMVFPSIFLCMFYWDVFLEYSCLIVYFSLFAMRYDLETVSGKERSIKSLILSGIPLGLAMLSKQTTGTFMAIAAWISCFASGYMTAENGKAKNALKSISFRMIGSSIPCFIFLFYLLTTGTFADFWEMCYEGIFTFESGYAYYRFMLENPAFFALGVVLPAFLLGGIIIGIVKRKEIKGRHAILVSIFGAFSCLHMIPLANAFHVGIAFVCIIPSGILFFTDKFKKSVKAQIMSGLFLTAAAIFIFAINPAVNLAVNKWTFMRGMELTMDPAEKLEETRQIVDYVAEKNSAGTTVYILDNMAPKYFMPSKQYHKYFDMFLNGNIGTKTPTQLLEAAPAGSIFLMPDRSRRNYQMPYDEEQKYMDTLEEIGRICDFTIYQK